MFVIAVNPYHLTTREPALMASLMLADAVVTMMPAPQSGTSREAIADAVERSPRFLRLMEAWRWCLELWRAGVIRGEFMGERVGTEVTLVRDEIRSESWLHPLASMLHEECLREADEYLDLLCADLLKGGPDPGLSVPVAAGLDRFASRHRLIVARSEPTSTAQKAELKLSRRLGAIAIPIPIQATEAQLLELRASLAAPLEALKGAISTSLALSESDVAAGPDLGAAANEFVQAFSEQAAPAATRGADEPPLRSSLASLTWVSLPSDAALRSSLAAAKSALGAGGVSGSMAPRESSRVVAMIVKPLAVHAS